MLPPGVILELKIHQNAFAARALAPDPTGGVFFTAPPDPIGGFHGALRGRRGEARKGQGREGEDGKGRGGKLPQFFFLQFHCWTQSHTTS